MRISIQQATGLGSAAIVLVLDGVTYPMLEGPVSYDALSWYYAEVTPPAGGPYAVQIRLVATDEVIGTDLVWGDEDGDTAVSGDDYAPNRAEVVKDALEMCGYDVAEDPEPAVLASAHRTLNSLIKALNVNGTDVNVIVRSTFSTVAGQASYDLIARGVDGAHVAVDGNDYLLRPITKWQYDAKVNKQSSGRPCELYHDRQAGKLYLWPCPDSAYTVHYGKIRQYVAMTDDEQTFDFPSSAIEMLTFGLAHRYSFKAQLSATDKAQLEDQFLKAERRYIVANSGYIKGQRAATCMVV